MRALSDAFRRKLEQNTTLLTRATLMLGDGTVRELTGDDIVTLSVEHGTSSSSSFDIGAAITGKLSITLNNHDGRFSSYDFTDASIVPYTGAETLPGTVEWLRLGTYTIDQPDAYAGTIALTALDNMSKFEVPFSEVGITFPADVESIVMAICSHCGVTLRDTFPAMHAVGRRPSSDKLTCKQVISYVAQACGCFARMDEWGRLDIRWYDLTAFEGESWLDGQHFDEASPYASGDDVDGGTFDNYGGGASAGGGTFEGSDTWVHIFANSSLTVNTDDVVITGIRVTAQNEVVIGEDGKEKNGRDGETSLYGGEGYVLSIEKNPLIEYSMASQVAQALGRQIIGMRFRPFKASCVTNPALEAGDAVVVTDLNQNSYTSFATSVKLTVNSSMSVSCDAKSASRNSAASSSAATEAIVQARQELKREQTAREQEMAQLQRELTESSGLYSTSVRQSDGSSIHYMHDRRELSRSKIVWKMTAEAVGVSTDGGRTYATALNANGVAILNRIYAIGLDADHITTGRISDRMGKNYWDMDTGEFSLSSASTVGGKTVTAIAQDAVNAQTQASVLAKLTNNGQSQGIYLSDGKLYINGEYIKANTVSVSKIENSRGSKLNANIGTTTAGNPGMSLNNSYGNYLDLEAMRAIEDPTKKTTGVGFSVFSEPFLDASTYYDHLWLWRPDAAYKNNYLKQTLEQLYLGKGSARLQSNKSRGLFLNEDSVTLKFSDTVYVKLDGSGVQVRCGSKGFGWLDGEFVDSLVWS